MPEITFVRGTFKEYRSTIKVHVGQIERDLWPDDQIEFDGFVLRVNGETFTVPQLRGGIKAGWLVPIEDQDSVYVPKPAGVEVRPAQDTGSKERMTIDTVDDEERVVGTVAGAAVGGRARQPEIGGAEMGVAVGKATLAAKKRGERTVIKDAAHAAQLTRKLDNRTRQAAPSILPLEPPAKKKATPAKKKKAAKKSQKKAAPSSLDLGGGVQWDVSGHWSQRVKLAKEKFGDDPQMLKKIMEVDPTKGVKNAIEKHLGQMASAE